MLETMEERNKNSFRFIPGKIHDSKIMSISFLNKDTAHVEVCTADDGRFVQDVTGKEELGGLGAAFYKTVLGRVGNKWLLIDFGGARAVVDGKSCADF